VAGGRGGEYSGMPFPVNHVFAGDVGEHEASLVPVDVMHVIPTFVEQGRVGIKG
jgi:hypothetical protein